MESLRSSALLRRIVLLGPALLVAALNLAHPLTDSDPFRVIAYHLQWWTALHAINLFAFPLMGLSAYMLVRRQSGWPVTISVIALAVFVPVYTAFDAVAGIGTSALVQAALSFHQTSIAPAIVAAYFNSPSVYALAATGSIAWAIAMIAAAVAFTPRDQRGRAALVAAIIFLGQGWARGAFFTPDGMPTTGWWLVAAASIVAMSLVGRPWILAGLLAGSAIFFGAMHTLPAGPLGALCFAGAAAYNEFMMRNTSGAGATSKEAGPGV